MTDNRERIIATATEVLGRDPDAGMGEIAVAAGVVRRTVYGHFPTRTALVREIASRAADEMLASLDEADAPDREADRAWADFVAHLWPLMHRYRVLVALRRGDHREDVHSALGPIDGRLDALVARGQESGRFARHLEPTVLRSVGWATVFTIADDRAPDPVDDARAPIVASLLALGVPEARAVELADRSA